MGSKLHCCGKCTVFTLLVLGIPLLIAGIILAAVGSFKSLAEDEIRKALPLESGSKSFENWETPEGELYIEYYVFNITNTNVLDGNIPEIKQLGPYTYREVSFNNVTKREGQTITYIPDTKYYFDQARSCENCNPITDKLLTINHPLLVILRLIYELKLRNAPPPVVDATVTSVLQQLQLYNIDIYQSRTVHELLWGYKDPALSKFLLAVLKKPVDDRVYALQFNNSGSGITKIHSGKNDVDRVAEYLEWKGFRTLPWWNSDAANTINGTSGSRFKPFIEKDDELYAVVTEICRSLKFTYDSTVKVHGIELHRYKIPNEVFQSGNINANNKGFCVTGHDKICLPSGLLDINGCKGGPWKAPPFVASTPHFYQGDSFLSKRFKLKPNEKLHGTFFDVEPNTGLTMQGHKRLQLNLAIPNFSKKNILQNVNTSSPVFFPLFFTDESAVITEDDADEFKKKVLLPLRVIEAVPYMFIALGGLFILIAVVIAVFLRNKMNKYGENHNEKGVVLESYPQN